MYIYKNKYEFEHFIARKYIIKKAKSKLIYKTL